MGRPWVRAVHGWLAHAGGPRPKTPPRTPPSQGGERKRAGPPQFPPLAKGGFGGVDSHRPWGVRNATVKRAREGPPNLNELPERVLARIVRGDAKGRAVGTPGKPRVPTNEHCTT